MDLGLRNSVILLTGSDLFVTMSIAGTVVQGFGYTADGSVNLLNPGSVAPSEYLITDLTYNQDARPSTLNSNGQPAIGFAYDGFGQRLTAENIPNAYDIIYQYGQDGLIQEEASSNGTIQADYIYLNNRPIAVLNPGTAALSFLHDDRLGTPQIATDSGQNIAWQTTYDPFGNTSSIGGTITQDLRLPGQVFDEIGGEYLNGFRDYLPFIGRYIEPDPLGRLGSGNNMYAYVNNNPTNLVDPFGLCPKCEAQPQSQTQSWTTTTVTVNSRPANIPGGQLLHDAGVNREWITTPDGTSVGMGTAQGVPQSDAPGVQTQVVDHTGQVPTSTQTFTGVDKAALATYTKVGTPTGRWIPGVNDCNTWVTNVVGQPTPHNIYSGFDPTGVPPHIIYRNVAVYADGSIHSPGGQ